MTALGPRAALERMWVALGGAPDALDDVEVHGRDPVLPSSYPIGSAAVAAVGVATMAAAAVSEARTGEPQAVRVTTDRAVTAIRSERVLRVDGKPMGDVWNPFSGFYRTADDRVVQLHTNFRHHLDRTLAVLEAPEDRAAVKQAIRSWRGVELEDGLARAGACATLARTREEWLAHPQGQAVHALPVLDVVELGDTPPRALPAGDRPLAGVRVLDLTRVIAGPVATRTLASHGAEVLRISSPDLPEVDALLPDTSIGKRSAFLDLHDERDRATLRDLVRSADVVVQSYRPSALPALGFGPDDLAALCPDIVAVSLSAYSHAGPWKDRRGYDTLVQIASGVAVSEGEAFASEWPRHLPVSGLDHATGYFAAAAAMLALVDRHNGGGTRHVRCSLAQTREWLETLGRADGTNTPPPDDDAIAASLPTIDSPLGRISYARPGGELARTPAYWDHGPVVPGSDSAAWT